MVALGAWLMSSCARTERVLARTSISLPWRWPEPPLRICRTIDSDAEFRPFQEVDVMAKVAGYNQADQCGCRRPGEVGGLLATLEIPEMADDQRRADAR